MNGSSRAVDCVVLGERPQATAIRARDWILGLLLVVVLSTYCLLAPRTGAGVNHNKDFSHLWIGGRMIASGQAGQLYNPAVQEQVYRQADPRGRPPAVWTASNPRYGVIGAFFYPPPTAVGYALLGWLPLASAAVVNAYLNIAATLLLGWLVSRRLGLGDPSFPLAALAILVHPACFATVSLGQNALLSLVVIVLGWSLCNRNQDFRAGWVWGLLILKPNLLLAVGWLPLVHRRWRMVLGMAAGAALVVGLTVRVTGPQAFEHYLDLLRRLAELPVLPGYRLALTYNGLSVFRKWLGVGWPAELLGWCSTAAILAVTAWTTRGYWQPGTVRFRRLMLCGFAAALWVNPHLFYYDLLLGVPCVLLMIQEVRSLERCDQWVVMVLVAGVYLAIPWDTSWAPSRWLPLPTVVTLAIWVWAVRRCRGADGAVLRC